MCLESLKRVLKKLFTRRTFLLHFGLGVSFGGQIKRCLFLSTQVFHLIRGRPLYIVFIVHRGGALPEKWDTGMCGPEGRFLRPPGCLEDPHFSIFLVLKTLLSPPKHKINFFLKF